MSSLLITPTPTAFDQNLAQQGSTVEEQQRVKLLRLYIESFVLLHGVERTVALLAAGEHAQPGKAPSVHFGLTHNLGRADTLTANADAVVQVVNQIIDCNGFSDDLFRCQQVLDQHATADIQLLMRLYFRAYLIWPDEDDACESSPLGE